MGLRFRLQLLLVTQLLALLLLLVFIITGIITATTIIIAITRLELSGRKGFSILGACTSLV